MPEYSKDSEARYSTVSAEEYAYLVFKSGEYVFARNGETGDLEFFDKDVGAVVQRAIDARPNAASNLIVLKELAMPAGVTLRANTVILQAYGGELTKISQSGTGTVGMTSKQTLDDLLSKYKVIGVPTNAGWTASNAGSGAVAYEPFRLYPMTGTTASSRGLAYCYVHHLNSGDIHRNYVDWTKRLELSFGVARVNSDAEAVARFQLKEANAEGALAQRGIGVTINNLAMVGEAYGTARGTVSIGSLTLDQAARIRIVKTQNSVEFWVNGVLVGTLTGSAVPNVAGVAYAYLVASIINGTTGGVNAWLMVSNIRIIQEW
jgi:hypothetical protein